MSPFSYLSPSVLFSEVETRDSQPTVTNEELPLPNVLKGSLLLFAHLLPDSGPTVLRHLQMSTCALVSADSVLLDPRTPSLNSCPHRSITTLTPHYDSEHRSDSSSSVKLSLIPQTLLRAPAVYTPHVVYVYLLPIIYLHACGLYSTSCELFQHLIHSSLQCWDTE